jgi:hypothetical protein
MLAAGHTAVAPLSGWIVIPEIRVSAPTVVGVNLKSAPQDAVMSSLITVKPAPAPTMLRFLLVDMPVVQVAVPDKMLMVSPGEALETQVFTLL